MQKLRIENEKQQIINHLKTSQQIMVDQVMQYVGGQTQNAFTEKKAPNLIKVMNPRDYANMIISRIDQQAMKRTRQVSSQINIMISGAGKSRIHIVFMSPGVVSGGTRDKEGGL